MAKACGLSQSSISRIWRAFSLAPHRGETFRLSHDPLFIEKVRDIVGLYLDPPDPALVLCVDEKSQIIALDRTAPLLPMRPGQVERRTHDYARHGTTSLFAALDTKSGTLVGQTQRRHRSVEFRAFLDTIEQNVPPELDVHLILDNYGTHKTQLIRDWLAKRPRFHLHFTLTSASWLNLVERWFALLTEKQLRRGVHRSTKELETAIRNYIQHHNKNPRPFVWHKTADQILDSVARFCKRTLDSGHWLLRWKCLSERGFFQTHRFWRNPKGCAILFRADSNPRAGMVELADAADSKSADRKVMGVRPPLPAPYLNLFTIINLQYAEILCA